MSIVEESWRPIAATLGFRDEEEMLKELYLKQGFSISEISHVVGYSRFNVRRRLILLHVPLRSRGGDNRSGRRKLAAIASEKILSGSPVNLAIEHGVHISTIFAERRLRRKECNSQPSAL